MGRMLLNSVLVAAVFQCTQVQISSAVACNCVREHVQASVHSLTGWGRLT